MFRNFAIIILLNALIISVYSFPNIGKLFEPDQVALIQKKFQNADQHLLNNTIASFVSKYNEIKGEIPEAKLLETQLQDITQELIYDAYGLVRKAAQAVNLGGGEDKAHPFQSPKPGAKRGPCPGLNTIANHGYIPRNGIVNPIELLVGTFEGLHLSPDLAAILAAVSFVGMGDLLTMSLSIGDRHGLGDGLNHHGILEGDASVTRQDHYFGNSWDAQLNLVEQFINETNTVGNGDVTVFSLGQSRYRAWDFSRKNNPVFDFNPWRGLVAYGESAFVHEVLRGNFVKFDEDKIKSWFLEERFPKGWKPRLVPFSTPELLAWAAVILATKPTVPGWSFAKGVFVPLPTSDGLYKELQSLLDPKTTGATVERALCDAANAFLGFFPSQLYNLFDEFGIGKVGAPLNCN